MNRYKLKLGFKGERKYIQGPDILNQAMQCIFQTYQGDLGNVEFLIHRMTGKDLYLEFESLDKGVVPEPDDIAILRLTVGNEQIQARIRPDSGTPDQRVAYDESLVTKQCQLDAATRSIKLVNDDSGFSQIEVLVSMNKALHLAVLDKPADTSWVFCRWDSPVWPLRADLSGATVTLKQTLGTRLTRADVELDGQMLGQIYFSAKAAS
jgi:hypothetical protein